MKLRFQADADLNQAIVHAVIRREPEIDFQTATQANLEGIADANVLALAAKDKRVLISHDIRTMPHHFGDFISHQDSCGVILISQALPIARAVEDLILIWSVTEMEEWENRIGFLPL